ncbi:MAG: PEP/pyruvate-binding domain-containing protein, partial [Thermoleophilia bacterium]
MATTVGLFPLIMVLNSEKQNQSPSPELSGEYWLDLRSAGILDAVTTARAGGKAANLARLAELDLPTPSAVVLTTDAWYHFIEKSGIRSGIEEALKTLTSEPGDFEGPARRIASLINDAEMPVTLARQMGAAYKDLSMNDSRPLAIRSSGSYEDSPEASFSGMLSTVLGVSSLEKTFEAVRKCWTSAFNTRSLRYLLRMGLDPAGVAVALIFQQMETARSSGVLFTVDPATGERDIAVLEAAYGYGPAVVSGDVTPDLYRINKK